MPQPQVNITVTDGSLGRRNPSADNVSAMIMSGVAASGLALNTVSAELKSLADAEAIGITSAYDVTNVTLAWYHIREFFKHNPDGSLYILLKSQATTLTQMADKATATGLKMMLQGLGGKIKQVGIARNPAGGYTPTPSGGLDADVLTAIAKAQEIAAEEFTEHRPVMIVVEGRSLNGTLSAATDLRTQLSKYVAVPVMSDKTIAAGNALFNGHAAVGAVLGLISLAKVNEDIGWPEKFRVDYDKVNWITPALSNNVALSSVLTSDLDALVTRGYIIPRVFVGLDGVYVSSDPVCEVVTSNYAYVPDIRTINKAVRTAYAALLPKLNSPLRVDPDTGYLASQSVKEFEQLVKGALDVAMLRTDEISGMDVYIDPTQLVLTTSTLNVKISIVPFGTARLVAVTIGFVLKI